MCVNQGKRLRSTREPRACEEETQFLNWDNSVEAAARSLTAMWEPAPLVPPGKLEGGTEFTQNMERGLGQSVWLFRGTESQLIPGC